MAELLLSANVAPERWLPVGACRVAGPPGRTQEIAVQQPSAPTRDQLRHRIDSGEAADKVNFPDPAAAPLGADAEAGGAPPGAAERRLAARTEDRERALKRSGPLPAADPARNARPPVLTLAFFAVLALALAAILVYVGR